MTALFGPTGFVRCQKKRFPSVLTRQDVFVSVLLDVLLLLASVGGVDLLSPVFGREPPQPLQNPRATGRLSVLSCAMSQCELNYRAVSLALVSTFSTWC